MADVTIDASVSSIIHFTARIGRGGPFWVSPTVGYVIGIDGDFDLVYWKTIDGGANWAAANHLVEGTIHAYDAWADWQTAGDAGTVIHIACIDLTSNNVIYVSLDTSDDSEATDVIEAVQGTGSLRDAYANYISITKARGGNIAVAFRYQDDSPTSFYEFYTSPDGNTWTNETSPWEAGEDEIHLFAGNEADNQDIWAAFWDATADEISLKTYDDSGDSWSEQSISGSMAEAYPHQMDGQIRLSDGHLILVAWSQLDNAASDLMVWDINGAGSITAKTNVITNTAEYVMASVFINQANDDIYVSYVGGTAWESEVAAFYQKSADGGGTWSGSDQAMQADAEDDMRWISAGCLKAANGGKFLPIWFDDDDNDLFCNTDNSISIAATGWSGEYCGVAVDEFDGVTPDEIDGV